MISVVTVKDKIQLYKGEEPANAIELVTFSEYGFEVVSAKNRFKVGDKAILIEPDYNLPDNNPLFADWVAPGGDPKKSKLGSRNRIRAVKFNLHRGDGMPVYSNGILLQLNEVPHLSSEIITYPEEIAAKLGIYKYQAPEHHEGGTGKAGASREFPQGLYKTDETNFNKVNWQFPLYLVGTQKLDGSSITLYYKNGKSGICSRNLDKPLTYKKKTGFKKGLFYKFLSYFGYNRNIYSLVESESEFVKVGKPYLEKLVEYCELNKINVALRGELIGKGASNGSGNKNNPHANVEPQIVFFGADIYNNVAERVDHDSFINIVNDLGFTHSEVIFDDVFDSKEELLETCNNYFKDHLIEGIVVRSLDGELSSKILNLHYDSLK